MKFELGYFIEAGSSSKYQLELQRSCVGRNNESFCQNKANKITTRTFSSKLGLILRWWARLGRKMYLWWKVMNLILIMILLLENLGSDLMSNCLSWKLFAEIKMEFWWSTNELSIYSVTQRFRTIMPCITWKSENILKIWNLKYIAVLSIPNWFSLFLFLWNVSDNGKVSLRSYLPLLMCQSGFYW